MCGWSLEGDPLITAVLNQQGTHCVVRLTHVAIGGHRRLDFDVREKAALAVLL